MYYNRFGLSEGVGVTKSSKSKECMISHYWFFDYGFKFQNFVCSGCHDVNS